MFLSISMFPGGGGGGLRLEAYRRLDRQRRAVIVLRLNVSHKARKRLCGRWPARRFYGSLRAAHTMYKTTDPKRWWRNTRRQSTHSRIELIIFLFQEFFPGLGILAFSNNARGTYNWHKSLCSLKGGKCHTYKCDLFLRERLHVTAVVNSVNIGPEFMTRITE